MLHYRGAMRLERRVRLALWIVGGLIALLVAVEAVDRYSSNRRWEAFHARVGQIREGMSEAEARAIAGPPDDVQWDLRPTAEPTRDRSWCRDAKASAALTYSLESQGWIGAKLGISDGILTVVVCLDDNRRVVKTFNEITQL